MKKILKWTAIAVLVLAVAGFSAFLYFIPPFFIAAPETFSKPMVDAAPGVADIKDPAERMLAERGKYLVVTGGCMGCHQTPGPQGPDMTKYLAGGMQFHTDAGTFVTKNLTPDTQTGLGGRTDEDVKRVLRCGVLPDGRVTMYRLMPWGSYSSWTDEDRHAVVVYLRHLPPVRHQIPDPVMQRTPFKTAGAMEEVYAGRDYSVVK